MSGSAESARLVPGDPDNPSPSWARRWRGAAAAAGAGMLLLATLALAFAAAGPVGASLGLGGSGSELPAIPTADETQTGNGRPGSGLVRGRAGGAARTGAVTGRADVASSPHPAVVAALLGSSRASELRHGGRDDSDRDKAYLVQPIIVHTLSARLLDVQHGDTS